MDAFEELVALLLRSEQPEGWWATTSYRVELTPEDKRAIGRHSSPRWEIDVLAYRGRTNEVQIVECKSFLDSTGVIYREGFEPPERYKMFTEPKLLQVVESRLASQLTSEGLCRPNPEVRLCMAAGHVAAKTDRKALQELFMANGWRLLTEDWFRRRLGEIAEAGYENEVAHVVAKLILRGGEND